MKRVISSILLALKRFVWFEKVTVIEFNEYNTHSIMIVVDENGEYYAFVKYSNKKWEPTYYIDKKYNAIKTRVIKNKVLKKALEEREESK